MIPVNLNCTILGTLGTMSINSPFENRIAVLATMHQKEKAIAPLLASELGMRAIVPAQFDTDRFGTFTREIERIGTQIEAARLKAQAALNLTGEMIAIAKVNVSAKGDEFDRIK
jgi:hypothetical protein